MKENESRSPRAAILTLGCRVNQYESDVIAGKLEEDGFDVVPFGQTADITIVNTCTVTAESDRKSRQHIRRAAAANPGTPILVTGCFAQVSPQSALEIPGVAAVLGNAQKEQIPALARAILEGTVQTPLSETTIEGAPYDSMTLPVPRRARAYIKIEDGCENRCAYCIIPAARGKVRSKAPEVVVQEAQALAALGCQEIILTGIETAAYGRETGGKITLGTLLPLLDAIPGIRRIGMGSLDPSLMRDAFLEQIASLPAVLPHFHLALQSGSSSVLRRMRRPYNAVQAMDRIRALRRYFPEVMLTSDVIVGFPGETEEEFEETAAFCREARFLHMHIFPYSVRKGTEAASMPDPVPEPVKRRRAARLAEIADTVKRELLEAYVETHREKPVYLLIEEEFEGELIGHSEHYAELRVPLGSGAVGEIIPVLLRETNGEYCRGVREN